MKCVSITDIADLVPIIFNGGMEVTNKRSNRDVCETAWDYKGAPWELINVCLSPSGGPRNYYSPLEVSSQPRSVLRALR